MPSGFQTFLVRKRAEHDLLVKQRQDFIAKHAETVTLLAEYMEARDTVNAVQLMTQNRIKTNIESVVTLALKSVFGEQYSLEIEYKVARNKSECLLNIKKAGECYSAEDECGGGVIDVVSFGLRVALWSISKQRSAPVFVLDEPGRFLSAEKAPLFGAMLSKISEMLGLQILMVSHSEALIDTADRGFRVSQRDGISKVVVI